MLEKNFESLLTLVEQLHPPGKILDVGAAYGLLLRVARTRSWDARTCWGAIGTSWILHNTYSTSPLPVSSVQ